MKLSLALKRLKSQGLIKHISPAADVVEERRGIRYNINAHCNYHRGKRHPTEQCLALKYAIQDLVDDRTLHLPNATKAINRANQFSFILMGFITKEEINPLVLIGDKVNGILRDDQEDP